jgi:hypothetical protein
MRSEDPTCDINPYKLTSGCEYFVLGVEAENFRVINDGGELILYPRDLFDVSDASIPPDWLRQEDEDGDVFCGPSATLEPGFFEDFFWSSGDSEAQDAAQKVLNAILDAVLEKVEGIDRAVLKCDIDRLLNYERRLTKQIKSRRATKDPGCRHE